MGPSTQVAPPRPTAYTTLHRPRMAEFFAGIGLVRAALEPLGAEVVWANDIEPAKQRAYAANHDAAHFHLGDVRNVSGADLPVGLDLATSSFPCVDLSLAGNRRGLAGTHSGMFYEFARVLGELETGARPRMVMLENVHGFATSHGGADLRQALHQLNALGYSCDVIAVDARYFVAQSRPRLFVIGVRIDGAQPTALRTGTPPLSAVRPELIQQIHRRNADLRLHYRELPPLPVGPIDLAAVVQDVPTDDARWWEPARSAAFLASLSPVQSQRLRVLLEQPGPLWR
ncbi:MAG: (cytosine-5-)-methyltransferase, partial [Jatrophihabitantaceae bacterium]|nr:(cytosine-5-)-methyltransferase [Jatrophihabitantaceae bacterium]